MKSATMTSMIGFNLLALGNDVGGVDRYSFSLITTMAKLFPQRKFYVFLQEACRLIFRQHNVTTISFSNPTSNPVLKRFFETIKLKKKLRALGFSGLLHSVNNAIPPICGMKHVVTVHDMLWWVDPTRFPWLKQQFLRHMVPFSVRRAEAVIAVSHSTKRDIIQATGVSGKKIQVIHEAVPLEMVCNLWGGKGSPTNRFSTSSSSTHPYFLFVGRLEPGKNVLGLIQAFEEALAHGLPPTILKIVGCSGWKSDYENVLAPFRHKPAIEFLGPIHDEELIRQYQQALAFVYPSFYEGFGLPVLEAMSAGVPVITSDLSSLPEVAGNAAILINPRLRQELVQAMIAIRTESNLRKSLVEKGYQQIRSFSWETAARNTYEVFQSVLGESA